jgi:NADH:ubiquinone oxidoreductase subunit 3 (subunit A)
MTLRPDQNLGELVAHVQADLKPALMIAFTPLLCMKNKQNKQTTNYESGAPKAKEPALKICK